MTTLEYFKGDDFAAEVWKNKYAQEGEQTPSDMHLRMAKEFARVRFKKDQDKTLEEWVEYFFNVFENQDNIPQGRVAAGLGVEGSYRSLSNCLRLPPPDDSYSSIMKTDTMLVSAAKRGCGYGVGLSKLRPKGAKTSNSSKTSTGILPFGERYSNSTKEVGQEGRRGACLEDLDIRHPESPEFATVKLDKTKLTGANISFKMWGDFLLAVKNDEDYILRFPCDISEEDLLGYDSSYEEIIKNGLIKYDKLYNGFVKNSYYKKIRAKELWNSSIHTVWSDGCPGLQFWERVMNYDPASVYKKFSIDGTNACGEQPMAVNDTCRLLTQMLLGIVKNPFTSEASIDWDKLKYYSYIQMEIGDDLIDLEIEYIDKIINKIKSDPEDDSTKAIELELWTNVSDMAKSGRRVGGGITGLADMLAALNLKYDSDEALQVVEQVMRVKFETELEASIDLAIKYGTFEGWSAELEKNGNDWYTFVEQEFPEQWKRMQKYGRRFVNWSTIAPVGTKSITTKAINYFNVSSGCEPQFYLYFFRNKKAENDGEPYDYIDEVGIRWKTFPIIMGAFKDYLSIKYSITDFDSLSKNELDNYYKESPWFGSTANDIDWKKRVEMQAVLQKYTTSAISSTINLPKDVKEEVISDIYMYAWEKGLKGITCYRDGSKGGVLVHEKKTDDFKYSSATKRPKELPAELHILSVKGIKYGVIIGKFNDNPYELFAFELPDDVKNGCSGKVVKLKKGVYNFVCDDGTLKNLQIAALRKDEQVLTRLVSGMLRHGAKPQFIMEQIDKCELEVVSFGKAISRVLKKYCLEEELIERASCDDCGGELIFQEGCLKCKSCGNSKC
jgi:ribonucleoside-diphosphate reductase alpha chain